MNDVTCWFLDEYHTCGGQLATDGTRKWCTACLVGYDNVSPQPAPTHNDNPALWDLVIADMRARDDFGRAKYGTALQPHNGRDALKDAYQEALDLCVYLRQAIYERDGA